MATARSLHDDAALRRVNFREDDYSYNNALHPQPFRNYSNPAAHRLVHDPNDFLRRAGPNVQEQQFEEQRKGSKLIKRQKSGNERTLRKRFFAGFRSKKSSGQKTPQVEEKVSKSGMGVKYMEIMSHDGPVSSETRDLNDSAWTTAFTTARPSIDLDDPIAEEDAAQFPAESQPSQTAASSPPVSSSYSPRLSNDQLHQLITDISGPTETPALPRQISQVYKSKTLDVVPASTSQTAVQDAERVQHPKPPHRESLRYSKSNEELFSPPKLTLNAELEALKMLKRYPTPDLIGASGATDPALALSSHPTAPPARPPPSAPPPNLRSVWSSREPHPVPTDMLQMYPQRALHRSGTDGGNSGTTQDQVDARREERKDRMLMVKYSPSMSNESNTSPLVAASSPASTRNAVPFYFSESEPESMVTEPSSSRNRRLPRATVRTVSSTHGPSHGSSASASDAIDPSIGLLINSNNNFLDSPRQSLQTERAAQRVSKVRERKLRDKKTGAGHTPPMHSSGPSSEDVTAKSPATVSKYPKDAPARKSSPSSTNAPPIPAVPSPSKIADHLSRKSSSRAGSVHSTDTGAPVAKKNRDRTPPPKGTTPPPLPMTDSPTDYHTTSSVGSEHLSASRIMLVAETSPKSSTGRSPRAYLAPGGGAQPPPRSSKRNSGLEARSRIADLERKNQLLEAALAAVLATAGRLNGCPCQGQGQQGQSQGIGASSALDALEMYRSTRAPSRLSIQSAVGPGAGP